ncbi:hypothetical protein [Streptomyces sp. NPDC001165]|uniref:hypothetical protein n=1 Tax=Streptomyces sp. NPDC001165 TaxID=3364546 RepID=UPI0036A26F91
MADKAYLRSAMTASGIALTFTAAFLTSSASAEPGVDFAYSENGWSSSYFSPSFDTKTVCDEVAGHHSGVGKFHWRGGSKTVWASRGKDTCEDDRSNVPEGVTVYYQACVGDKSTGKIWDCGVELWTKNVNN